MLNFPTPLTHTHTHTPGALPVLQVTDMRFTDVEVLPGGRVWLDLMIVDDGTAMQNIELAIEASVDPVSPCFFYA
jgi:hypothetical protein